MADLPVPIGLPAVSFGPVLGEVAYALIGRNPRIIGTIIPDVVVEEIHHDELAITDHPVEIGSAVTDHAFHLPYELQMRIGFSNSTAQAEGYVQAVYAAFQALQLSREPFSVSTGKRLYQNMLIRSMQVTTDVASEFALNMVVQLREIIIVYTQPTDSSTGANSNPQTASQTSPSQEHGDTTPKADNPEGVTPGSGQASTTNFGGTTPSTGGSSTTPDSGGSPVTPPSSPQAPAAVPPPSDMPSMFTPAPLVTPPTPWSQAAITPSTVPSLEPITGYIQVSPGYVRTAPTPQ